MKKLVLIDGNAILHRAYHAMPGLTNSSGQPIGAVYGFFSMLLNMLSDQKPDYLAICFDRSKPTIRQAMYAGYHEHRPPMDGELTSQVTIIDELLQKMNVATYSLEGYEGDDVIGTLAAKAARINTNTTNKYQFQMSNNTKKKKKDLTFDIGNLTLEILIVTGDRDMLQLVNEHVKVLMTITGITKTMLFDEQAVEEKYGIKPSQFIDYKALIGDPSDGYPGITGIGPKTAASLLKQFGTFEALYNRINEVPEKLGLKLATDAEQGALAKTLATIITDAPIKLDLASCDTKKLDMKGLESGFREHNFKSLLKRIGAVVDEPKEEGEQLGLL